MPGTQKISPFPPARQPGLKGPDGRNTASGIGPAVIQRQAREAPPDNPDPHQPQANQAPVLKRGTHGLNAGLLILEKLLAGLPSKLDGK